MSATHSMFGRSAVKERQLGRLDPEDWANAGEWIAAGRGLVVRQRPRTAKAATRT